LFRHRFETYLDKVFNFSQLVGELPEGRQFPQHPWQKVFDAVFLGAALQIRTCQPDGIHEWVWDLVRTS